MIGVLLWSILAVGDPAADVPAADVSAGSAQAAAQAESAPTAEQLRFFETSVRPVLVEHCHKCHGPKKQWANLRLDSHAAVLRGGDSGPAVVPGNSGASRLVRAIRQTDDELKMPEDGKLTGQQIAALIRWVEMGVPYPAAAEPRPRA